MISINIFCFILGVLTYFLYKKLIKRRIKYVKLEPIIENKIFEKSSELILREQLNRNYLFFGEQGMSLIRNSCVLIINCENIGSHVAVTLARSGIKKLILIDNHKLNIENYKYHPFACLEDINKDNLDILNNYIKKINPNSELLLIKSDIININLTSFLKKEKEKIDYILDCSNIDNIPQKCKIIHASNLFKIKLISIFPQFKHMDNPTLIRHSKFSSLKEENPEINNLFIENYKKLFNKEEIPEFILIYSSQKNQGKNYIPKENLFCYGVIADTACSLILCNLANFQFEKDEIIENIIKNKDEQKISGKFLSEAIQEYKREEIDKKKCDKILMDKLSYNDFRNICTEFKNGSCLKMKQVPKMKFIRWRSYKDPSKDNIVMMGKEEISKHINIKNEEDLINYYGKNTVERIDKILNKLANK